MMHVLLFVFVLICLYTDLKTRKIYNKTVLAGFLAAWLFHLVTRGVLAGTKFTFCGFFTGAALLLVPYLLGGMGAGDVKMLGMIGAFVGSEQVVQIMLAAALAGGVMALTTMLKEGELGRRLKNLFLSLYCFLFTRGKEHLEVPQDEKQFGKTLPYGVVLAIGVVIFYLLNSFNYTFPGFSALP
ncbi:MAG: peptidase A24 [Firmicutes bacterium]|jgi:prepilin peptidase CpaA|nr:peptidase A24 [Bacillota bacterium]